MLEISSRRHRLIIDAVKTKMESMGVFNRHKIYKFVPFWQPMMLVLEQIPSPVDLLVMVTERGLSCQGGQHQSFF